jgi:hypothetical protein
MWTHPIYRPDGSLHAFEIRNLAVWIGTIMNLLRSVDGVTEVRRSHKDDDRVVFLFKGEPYSVLEPWGDNSRYLIGAKDPSPAGGLDLSPVMQAFIAHRGPLHRMYAWLFGSANV